MTKLLERGKRHIANVGAVTIHAIILVAEFNVVL